MTSRARGAAAFAVAACLAITACSSSDSPSTATGGTAGPTPGSGVAAACTLDRPVRIAELVEIKGESNVAIDDFHNGADMAVAEINAAGGICGQPIELTRFPTSAIDPNEAVNALLQAQDIEPDLILGFPNSSIVTAIAGQIDRAGIPTITMGGTPSGAGRMDDNGSDWIWALFLPNSVGPIVDSAADYMVKELGLKDLGMLYADNATFQGAKTSFETAVTDAGGTISVSRSYALTATDLTEQVLAMKDTDGVINWGLPNQTAVFLNQEQQNDAAVPNIGTLSAAIVVDNGLAAGATDQLYASVMCNPVESSPEWSASYVERFPASKVNQTPAAVYDGVHLFKAAVESAGSVEHDAVREALNGVQYSGVCSKDYHSDATGTLGHGVTIISYADGTSRTAKSYEGKPLEGKIP